MSLTDIKTLVKPEAPKPLLLSDTVGWDSVENHIVAMRYLEYNNCVDAYTKEPERFFFDRIRNRVVFTESLSRGTYSLATGRSILGDSPKWYKYVAMPSTYYTTKAIYGETTQTIVVEDCASASSASRLVNAIALCGTNWNSIALIQQLMSLDTEDVIVCLDADAQLKSMQLQRDLVGLGKFKSVRMVTPRDDIKYLSLEELQGVING